MKFRRQYSIGNFIIDFYCPEIKLAVEIDGATHGTPEELRYDAKRQKYLENLGIKVKRYTNTDVKENISGVLYDLYLTCRKVSQ